MTSWAITRFIAVSAVSLSASALPASTGKNAFFCHGKHGEGLAFAAVREIPDGDIQFAISKWQYNGKFFGLHGIAQKAGDVWIYKERHRKIYVDDELIAYEANLKPHELPTCKVTIRWGDPLRLHFEIDPVANCDDHAGYGFHEKSTEFGAADFDGPVKNELDDTDRFYNGGRCDKSRRRS